MTIETGPIVETVEASETAAVAPSVQRMRPPLWSSISDSVVYTVRFTRSEHAQIKAVADRESMTLSQWLRQSALHAAEGSAQAIPHERECFCIGCNDGKVVAAMTPETLHRHLEYLEDYVKCVEQEIVDVELEIWRREHPGVVDEDDVLDGFLHDIAPKLDRLFGR